MMIRRPSNPPWIIRRDFLDGFQSTALWWIEQRLISAAIIPLFWDCLLKSAASDDPPYPVGGIFNKHSTSLCLVSGKNSNINHCLTIKRP